MSEQSTSAPAGWYPDPNIPGGQRWWDGANWTPHVGQAPYQAVAPRAPEGTKTDTVWIWIIVLMPLLGILPVFFLDVVGYMRDVMLNPTSTSAMLSLYTSPGYILTLVLSFLMYGLTVLFAFFDVRELKRRLVPQPFHWAFAFLPYGTLVYVIGRSVVARRRAGGALTPLWVLIGVYLLTVAVSLIWSFWLVQQMMQLMPAMSPLVS